MTRRTATAPSEWCSNEPEFIDLKWGAVDMGVDRAIVTTTRAFYPLLRRLVGNGRKGPSLNGSVSGLIGKDFVVYRSEVGAPAEAMLLESLIASGIRTIVMLGLAGSLNPGVRVGDVVIPTWGVREEGTSYHYVKSSTAVRPSNALAADLRKALGEFSCHEGGVWTIDAPYRETKKKVQALARQGVLAIDMETTALMAVCMRRKVDFAAALVISDELFGERWDEYFKSRKLSSACGKASRAVAGMMSR